MKEHKNTKIIGIDEGYGNIKTANTVTPTAITAYDTEPIFSGNILEYGSMYYRIGDRQKRNCRQFRLEFLSDKWMDDDFYLLTLAGNANALQAEPWELHREHLTQADVHLAAGLPLTWVRRQREPFREYLMQKPQVSFRFNQTDYHINLTGCSIYPQGYPAIVEHLADFKGTNMLADIGNGTMNVPEPKVPLHLITGNLSRNAVIRRNAASTSA